MSDEFKALVNKYNGDFNKFADAIFTKSMFRDSALINKFFMKPDAKTIQNDLAYKTTISIIDNYMKKINPKVKNLNTRLENDNRLYIAGLMEMKPNKKFYPNANSTMRVSYGSVLGYTGMDAVNRSEERRVGKACR